MRPNRKYRETLRVGCAALSLSMELRCAPLAVSAAETENAKEKAEIHWTISDAEMCIRDSTWEKADESPCSRGNRRETYTF